MFEPLVVPSFGGGLDFRVHPTALRDDQWSFSEGWIARDGYAEVVNPFVQLATVGTGTEQIIGMLQNPFTWDGAVVVTVDASNQARGYTVTGAGTVTALAGAFTQPNGTTGNQSAILQAGFLNGFLVFTCGASAVVTGNSLVKWDGTAAPVAVFGLGADWDFLSGFSAHVIVALGGFTLVVGSISEGKMRTLAWSATNDPDTWTPAVANDADNVVLDDADSGISGIIPLSPSTFGIFTRNSVHALAATGGIPAFTRQQLVRGIGCQQIRATNGMRRQSFYGTTPYGAVFYGADNLYRTAGEFPEAIGHPIFRYWVQNLYPNADPSIEYAKPFIWHDELGLLMIPRPVATASATEGLYWHAQTQVWSRVAWASPSNDPFLRQAYIYGYVSSMLRRRHWLSSQQKIFVEDPTTVLTNRTVDTKDFHFGDPSSDDYVDRVKIDWEPLTNATTDALEVLVSTRNDFSKGILGSAGLDTQGLTFTSLGTLTGGSGELFVRTRGKYTRFRFRNTSGKIRIRGLTLRRERAGDRAT